MVLLFLAPVLVGREGFRARNKGKGPVPLWSKCSCSRVCLEIQGGFDHCSEALITAFCSSPGSAPFSCPFIHSILSFLPTCVLTLGGIALPQCDPSFPPPNKEAAAGRDGAGPVGENPMWEDQDPPLLSLSGGDRRQRKGNLLRWEKNVFEVREERGSRLNRDKRG